jgi:hypothetical protein
LLYFRKSEFDHASRVILKAEQTIDPDRARLIRETSLHQSLDAIVQQLLAQT